MFDWTALRNLRALLGRSYRARGGNVSILFAFSAVPLVGLLGLGIDYGMALNAKAKLDNAADTAAIAAVATAKAYVAANTSDANVTANAIKAGLTRARNSFSVNAGSLPSTTVATPQISLTFAAPTFTSTVTYSASSNKNFGQMFGSPTIALGATVSASAQIPAYLDFYLLLDVSGSMGLPSDSTGQSALALINTDLIDDYHQGCQFACHFPGFNGWNLAVANHIQLRSGAVNSAVCSMVDRAKTSTTVPNQFRIALYPFINQMSVLTALTSDMGAVSAAGQCDQQAPMALTNLLDTGVTQLFWNNDASTGTGSGGTHFETVFPQVQSMIVSYGNGASASSSKPFVFLITDGMENTQHFAVNQNGKYYYSGSPSKFTGVGDAWFDGSNASVLDSTQCQAIKGSGVTISILYIPYIKISYVPNSGIVSNENATVNGFSSNIPSALTQCATPGFFHTANSPADITSALNAMFNQAVQAAHLTR